MSKMRKHKKKRYNLFSEENMSAAIREILKGNLRFSEAVRRFDIKKSTLAHRLRNVRSCGVESLDREETPIQKLGLKNGDKHSKFASSQVFTNEEERALVEYLQICSKINDGLTVNAIREAGYRLAVCWDIKFPASWATNEKAGKTWTNGFINRHKDLPPTKQGKPTKEELEKNEKWKWYDISTFLEELKHSGWTVPNRRTRNDDNLNSDLQEASSKIIKSEDDQLDSTNEIFIVNPYTGIACKTEENEDLESLHFQADSAVDVLSPEEEPESEVEDPVARKPRSPRLSNAKRKFIIDGVCSSVSFQLSNEELQEEDLVAFHSDLITYMHSYFNKKRKK